MKKGVYKGVTAEIENAFKGKDIDEIRRNRDMILQQDGWKIIKLRLQDKKQHLSKRDGYRLIYLVSMTEEKNNIARYLSQKRTVTAIRHRRF